MESKRKRIQTEKAAENQQASERAANKRVKLQKTYEERGLNLLNEALQTIEADIEAANSELNPTEIAKSQQLEKYRNRALNSKSPAIVFAVRLYGPEAVAKFLIKKKAVRYMFAPADNTGQCVRAGVGVPSKCWLCDYPLLKPDGSQFDTIACEHILPVVQGVMFADIALSKLPSTSTPELVRAEYEWAHAVCNGPKSASVFIKETRDGSGKLTGWTADTDVIEQTLRETIPGIQSKDIDGGKLSTLAARNAWVTDRIPKIIERLSPILTRINHPDSDSARMIALFGMGKLLDSERLASTEKLDQAAYNRYVDQVLNTAQNITEQNGSKRRRTKRKRGVTRKRKNNKGK
jgi:hypothetical protein